MTGKTHQLIGLVGGLVFIGWGTAAHYAPATFAGMLLGAHFGALLPDIDSGAADIWQHIPLGRAAGKLATNALGHRNITHSLLGVGLFGWLAWWLLHLMPVYWNVDPQLVWVALMIGYITHLIADMLTVEGIPLLWPAQHMFGIPPRPLEGMRIMTGGWFELLVLFPILNLILIGLVWSLWPVWQLWLFR